MAEFPAGHVREVRRGGAGVLELLLLDLSQEEADGYIKVERRGEKVGIGQLVLSSGRPVMCIHEADELTMGRAALEALRTDAAAGDSRLSIHDDVDLEVVFDLHPEARLHLDEEAGATGDQIGGWADTASSEAWWEQQGRKQWSRAKTDAEIEAEALAAADPAPDLPRTHTPGEQVEEGYCYLVDSQSPAESLTLVRHLTTIGHHLLVISRLPPARLGSEYGIDPDDCRWLTDQSGHASGAIEVSLESVRREFETFMSSTQRSVMLLDGLEFLSGVHGFQPMLGMLHTLLDTVQSSDHVMFIPADLEVWDSRQRGLLLRELDCLPTERVTRWSEHPAEVEGHSFCQQEGIFRQRPRAPDLETARVQFQDLSERLTVEAQAALAQQVASSAERAPETAKAADPTVSDRVVRSDSGNADPIATADSATAEDDAGRFSMRSLIDEWKQEQEDESPEPELEPVTADSQLESDLTEKSTDDDALPDWATAPSENRMLELEESSPEIAVKAAPEEESESDAAAEQSVLRQPTTNHRPSRAARGSRRRAPSSRALEVSAIVTAADKSIDLAELSTPESPQSHLKQATLGAARDKAVEITGLEARGVEAGLHDPGIPSGVDTHVGSWDAAAGAASGEAESSVRKTSENPAASHVAARGQRTRSLTHFLAGKEIEALWDDRIKTVEVTGIDPEVLDRLRELADEGHPVKEVVHRIESDMSEGLALLVATELRAEQAAELLERLGELESQGIIDEESGARMRTAIISLEDLDRLNKLFNDLQE